MTHDEVKKVLREVITDRDEEIRKRLVLVDGGTRENTERFIKKSAKEKAKNGLIWFLFLSVIAYAALCLALDNLRSLQGLAYFTIFTTTISASLEALNEMCSNFVLYKRGI